MRQARLWSELRVGQSIMFRGDERDFLYRLEAMDWKNRKIELSIRRPRRIRREVTEIRSIGYWIRQGRIFIIKEES